MVDMESANSQLGIAEGENGLMLPPAPRAPKVRCHCLPPFRPSWLLAAGADRPSPAGRLVAYCSFEALARHFRSCLPG